MSDDPLISYVYPSSGTKRIPGTEDWVIVAELGNGGYEWEQFKAFYSPSDRQYFWHGDTGCSCNDWSDGIGNASDFKNGSKLDLIRAWADFCKEHPYAFNITEFMDGTAKLRGFNGD